MSENPLPQTPNPSKRPNALDATWIANRILREVGTRMVGQLGEEGIRDEIFEHHPPWHTWDADDQQWFYEEVNRNLFG